jgi:hypothetical protein
MQPLRKYGYAWWITEYVHEGRTLSAHYAAGNGGQLVIVVPEWDVRGGVGYARQLDEREAVFAAEVAIIPRIGLEQERRGAWTTTLLPEIAWSGTFDRQRARDHYALTGVGLGLTWEQFFTVGLVPQIGYANVLVEDQRRDAFGARVLLLAELIQILGVQVSYELAVHGDGVSHDLRVTGSLNLFPLWIAALITDALG